MRISIHALLAESDRKRQPIGVLYHYFYPRSPCGERPPRTCPVSSPRQYFYPRSPCGERPLAKVRHCEGYVFLSTLSLRRATAVSAALQLIPLISIHALLAESDYANFNGFYWWVISIHALLAESDRSGHH